MPTKRKTTRRTTRKRGKGFFGDVWNGVKRAATFAKDNKLLSTGLALTGSPWLAAGARIAGYGKHRRHRGRGMNLTSEHQKLMVM